MKKSMPEPSWPSTGSSLQHEVGLVVQPALRFRLSPVSLVDAQQVVSWFSYHVWLIVAGPSRTKPGSKIRSSASRPASITAGLVNPTSPVVQAS